MWNIAVKWINEVGRWGRRCFRFDNAKVGLCLGWGAMSETLHDEEPKVGARALQGLRAGTLWGAKKPDSLGNRALSVQSGVGTCGRNMIEGA